MRGFKILGLAALLLANASAWAGDSICVLDNGCPYGGATGTSNNFIGDSYGGVRENANTYAMTPIVVHGTCRYVDNISSTLDGFIPFKSLDEWSAFLSKYPPEIFRDITCGCPYGGGQNDSYNLRVGPTELNSGMGDQGAQYAGVNAIGYGRTGASYSDPTTYSINDSCYEEYAQYKCWNWVSQSCTGCASMGISGCESSYQYDCSYCADEGSTCEKRWYDWTETFRFSATALNCEATDPSWQGSSSHQSGSRPGQCNTRCTDTGHDCTGCNTIPATNKTCSVPPAQEFDAWTKLFCTTGSQNVMGCVSFVVTYNNYENTVAALVSSGDLCAARDKRNEENSWVADVNAAAQLADLIYFNY